MVAARRDQRMVSAARQTGADTAQCGFPDRMEHHLPRMGISGGLVLTSEAPARKSAVRLWFFQLGCNFLWSILFFVCRSPLLGMAGHRGARCPGDPLSRPQCKRTRRCRMGSSSLTSAGSSSPPTSTPISSLRTGRGCKPGKGAMCSRTKDLKNSPGKETPGDSTAYRIRRLFQQRQPAQHIPEPDRRTGHRLGDRKAHQLLSAAISFITRTTASIFIPSGSVPTAATISAGSEHVHIEMNHHLRRPARFQPGPERIAVRSHLFGGEMLYPVLMLAGLDLAPLPVAQPYEQDFRRVDGGGSSATIFASPCPMRPSRPWLGSG